MKRIGVICFALVLALGMLGVGYAMWSEELVIETTVETGEVCYGFIDYFLLGDPCVTPPSVSPDPTCDPGFLNRGIVPGGKDVACTTATWINQHTVEITLDKAYPCYLSTVSVHTENCGTIPIKLGQCKLTYYIDGTPYLIALPDSQIVYIWGHDQYGGISEVIELKWVNGTGAQLEPGDEHEDSVHIHVLQPAKQDSTYSFTITREAVQWNEYEPPP